MVDFFTKSNEGTNGQPSVFKRYIKEHDIRDVAGEAGVTRITNSTAIDVIGLSPYEELAADVRSNRFDIASLKTAMEEAKDIHGYCSLQELREQAGKIFTHQESSEEILTGWEQP